jgi:hypothetical protein
MLGPTTKTQDILFFFTLLHEKKTVAVRDVAMEIKLEILYKNVTQGLKVLHEIFSLLIFLLQTSQENTTFKL